MDHALHLLNLCWICVHVCCRKHIEGELLRFFRKKSVSVTGTSCFSVHSFEDQWNAGDKNISPLLRHSKAQMVPVLSVLFFFFQELLARFHSFSPNAVNRWSMETLADRRRTIILCCWNLKLSHFARWIVTKHFKQCQSILKPCMIIDTRLAWMME